MVVAKQGLPRCERLRGSARFDALFSQGRIGKSRLVLCRMLENDAGLPRMAAVAGKAAGNAVVRNRLRRRLRAIWREEKERFPTGRDYVLLARRGAFEADSATLRRDLIRAVERALQDDQSS